MFIIRGLWRALNFLRRAFFSLLVLAILVSLLMAGFSSDEPRMPDEAALILQPGEAIVEKKRLTNPLDSLFSGNEPGNQSLLSDLLQAVNRARDDERVQLLVLDLRHLVSASLPQLEALSRAIDNFKTSDKPVYAFAPDYSQTQYYLAVHADHLFIESFGASSGAGVFLRGFGSYPLYMKDALDKLKVGLHVFRVGDYKSAVEPYVRNDMSEEAKENTLRWLGDLWNSYQQVVIQRRNLAGEDLNHYINNYDRLLVDAGNNEGKLAVSYGLVDKQMTRHEWQELLNEQIEPDDQIDHRHYLAASSDQSRETSRDGQIGLIVAEGLIVDGQQPEGVISGRGLAKLIQKARKDQDVKALILRINSNGGSAYASERIRHELAVTRRAGKPVVVSMGGVAASGGYWVASTADRILAETTTITGSIGIFALLPSLQDSFETIGLRVDGVGTTELSDAGIPMLPLNPILERSIQQAVEQGYTRFVQLVAEGRDMEADRVRDLAQGKVYTGKQALALGLIDRLGGTREAVEEAADLAELETYSIKPVTPERSFMERIFHQLMQASWWPHGVLRQLHPMEQLPLHWQTHRLTEPLHSLSQMTDPDGLYLQCFTCQVH